MRLLSDHTAPADLPTSHVIVLKVACRRLFLVSYGLPHDRQLDVASGAAGDVEAAHAAPTDALGQG